MEIQVAVSKSSLRTSIRQIVDPAFGGDGTTYEEIAGVQLWSKSQSGAKFAYSVQLNDLPLDQNGGGKLAIRYYGSPGDHAMNGEYMGEYMPKRSITDKIKAFMNVDSDWISFQNPADMENVLKENLAASIERYEKFIQKTTKYIGK